MPFASVGDESRWEAEEGEAGSVCRLVIPSEPKFVEERERLRVAADIGPDTPGEGRLAEVDMEEDGEI